MHKIACALALFASAGHGRRVQSAAEQRWQRRLQAESQKPFERSLMLAFNLHTPASSRRTGIPLRECPSFRVKEMRRCRGHRTPMMYSVQGFNIYTEKDLKARLKALGQKVCGNKPEMIASLRGYAAGQKPEGRRASLVAASALTFDPVQKPLLWSSAAVAAGVEHGQLLPEMYTNRIPAADEEILNFLLVFMQAEGLDYADVYINGGYVRDLLRGREPDDLDLSVCLQDAPEEVTVAGLMEKLPAFAQERPELGILNVSLTTILANQAKSKLLDAFKSDFLNNRNQKIEVDVMPTIGDEHYEAGSRFPLRNHRGCVEEDALRRDLTVGALLLKIERGSPGSNRSLSYRMLDFYGGLADLRAGVLRAPFPRGQTYQEVAAAVLRTDAAKELAESLSLSSQDDPEAVQILWWAKLLMDDPVRVCRALRFVATLQGFAFHESFWHAVPFALEALRSTVAGNRKYTEFVKLAGSGYQACVEFMETSFMRTVGPGNSQHRLAPALFGGLPSEGPPAFLSEFDEFDQNLFRELAGALDGLEDPEKLLGGLLACAAASARGLEGSLEENFLQACEGLGVSGVTCNAGDYPLYIAHLWAQDWNPPNMLDTAFAGICGISPEAMQMHSRVWKDFKMPGSPSCPCLDPELQELTLRFARHFINQGSAVPGKEPQLPEGLPDAMLVAVRKRSALKGNLFCKPGVLDVPPRLRTQVMALLEVTLRLIDYDNHIEDHDDLEMFLDRFPTIRQALTPETLKSVEPEYRPIMTRRRKRKPR